MPKHKPCNYGVYVSKLEQTGYLDVLDEVAIACLPSAAAWYSVCVPTQSPSRFWEIKLRWTRII